MAVAPALGTGLASGEEPSAGARQAVPVHLRDHAALFADDPRAASLAWFKQAKFGLFMHFGIYSLLNAGEWVQLRRPVPFDEYTKLPQQFDAKGFDADFITDLAAEAGMRYITITARHHDSFCLFETMASDYHVGNTPTRRDLIGELATRCREKGIGLFLYYSLGADWHHPFFYGREFSTMARPPYDPMPAQYRFREDADFVHYLNFCHTQLAELLTNYGPLAGIWFDPLMGYYARPDLFPIDKTYALVRKLQPHALISFKQGVNGDEDFTAPEHDAASLAQNIEKRFGPESAAIAGRVYEANRNKPIERCRTLQHQAWGCNANSAHHGPEEAWAFYAQALNHEENLLLNTGPLPDGSIDERDVGTLRECGQRLVAR
jgi:alpha-L-fucosidase